jgi:RNA polymerase sigma-70 factor (ECF subfamily)
LATLRNSAAQEAAWNDVAVLVRRAQRGDREAFGRLIEQFQRTVHAICLRRIGNPSEALELTQEVFLHVMHTIDQLREPERFAGWLRQIAVRMAINRATRRVAPTCVEMGVLEGALEQRHEPVNELIHRERAQRLWEGLARLKPLDRETLVAFYIQGQSLIEISDRLDTPIGTIKRRLHTARKRLRAELQASTADADEWTDAPFGADDGELVGAAAEESDTW